MSEEVIIPSGFTQNPIDGTNPPPMKKKRNLPGTPGELCLPFSFSMHKNFC